MAFQIPLDSLIGGMLLGVSGLVLLALNGRIAGISGIVGGLLRPKESDFSWRLLFVGGMVAAGMLASISGISYPDFAAANAHSSPLFFVGAGLLVGIGTKLANGCTSGHGICGMGRLSKRSIAATLIFMPAAFITVFIRLHL
ncbi:YeeE/YedE family protein [Grimontia kaedaensis]|uniref:YeeE/YedE family protein n=1 Tax=Grimontia kaedaensis TaxID=2872157 RepID=A0ABY4X1G0_9GAMM|nr:YeeE/YedE thiosulfate transporter family protein [Grimontia kaedaensis]USH05084.1 YeeE/YedE family protein [Grimontia kaedaensis]